MTTTPLALVPGATPAIDLAYLLAADGLVTLDGTDRDAFDSMPDGPNTPDRVVVFSDRGTESANLGDSTQYEQVIIRVRGAADDKFQTGIRAKAIADALNGLADQALPASGDWLDGCWATYGGVVSTDAMGRPVHMVRVRLMIEHETALKASPVAPGDSGPTAPANTAPVVNGDTAAVISGSAVTINVLANDADPDGDTLHVTGVAKPGHGTAVLNTDGTVTYTPNAGYTGTDSFLYTVTDGQASKAATVTVTVQPKPNTPPVAGADTATVTSGGSVTIPVLSNDTDADSDPLTVASVDAPAHGTAVLNPDSTITYTPNAGYTGTDTVTYVLSDGKATTQGTDTISVAPKPNTPPVAVADSATVTSGGTVTIPVLANDTDLDGDSLSIVTVGAPAHGSASANSKNQIVYTSTSGYTGTDTFTYVITDGKTSSAPATVTVTVSAPATGAGSILFSANFNTTPNPTGVSTYTSEVGGLPFSNTSFGPGTLTGTAMNIGSASGTGAAYADGRSTSVVLPDTYTTSMVLSSQDPSTRYWGYIYTAGWYAGQPYVGVAVDSINGNVRLVYSVDGSNESGRSNDWGGSWSQSEPWKLSYEYTRSTGLLRLFINGFHVPIDMTIPAANLALYDYDERVWAWWMAESLSVDNFVVYAGQFDDSVTAV